MVRWIPVPVFWVLAAGLGLASFEASAESAADRLAAIRSACFSGRDWTQATCDYQTVADFTARVGDGRYVRGWGDALVADPLIDALMTGLDALYAAGDALTPNQVCLNGACITPQPGAILMNDLASDLEATRSTQNLSDCQAACMVLCVSSRIIDYEASLRSKFGSMSGTADRGIGVCTEFTRLGDWLAWYAGLASRTEGSFSGRHAFLALQIGSDWYYAEPQSERCRFAGYYSQ